MEGRYYLNPHVRRRMIEYLGGDTVEAATCEYLTAGDERSPHSRDPLPVSSISRLWEQDLDISRSLWDRDSFVFHLDIEYVNFDSPAEPYIHPERVIELQRHVEWVVEAVLRDYRIQALHLLSGRGHHYAWQIPQASLVFSKLISLGEMPASLAQLYGRPHRPYGSTLPMKSGKAFMGAGLVMEYVAHRIKELAAPMCELPVELTAVEVGPRGKTREMISIDISEYADPLTARVIRVPFSLYLKPRQQRSILGEAIVETLQPFFLIPLSNMDSSQGIAVMRDPERVAALASNSITRIPEQPSGTEELIDAYRRSSLAQFHDWFYAQEPQPREAWSETYDRLCSGILPPCARHILENPNDLLLKPAGVERIVRVLLSLGWHPRHIAGLIWSKFERDYQWGDQWKGYDPAMRADFYTRLFAGLFAVGRDDLVDFNCESAREEHFCFVPDCTTNLEPLRQSLLDRRKYERLASRPFNRLFLPKEHL